jgi:hypothetical protein
MSCYPWKRVNQGTAPFPKVKKYQKLKRGAYNMEEDSEIDLYSLDQESWCEEEFLEDEENNLKEECKCEDDNQEDPVDDQEEQVSKEKNRWDVDSEWATLNLRIRNECFNKPNYVSKIPFVLSLVIFFLWAWYVDRNCWPVRKYAILFYTPCLSTKPYLNKTLSQLTIPVVVTLLSKG